MFLLRRSGSLLSPSSGFRLTAASSCRPSYYTLHVSQKRGNHNDHRSSNRKHYKPEIVQEQEYRRNNENQYHHAYFDIPEPEVPEIKVRILRPVIFTLLLSSGFYAFFSYRQAKEELTPRKWNIPNPVSSWTARRTVPTPTEVVSNAWGSLDPVSKLTWSLVGANSAIHLFRFVAPNFWMTLWHTPARNVQYTLFTSAFVHDGILHYGFNMFGMFNFLPMVGYSPLFRGNTNHLASFYLSTAVIASLAQHVASTVFARNRVVPPSLIPSGGASGVLFAVLGSWCMQYPTHEIGIVFLPFSFEAQYFFPAVMLFDLVGMVRGFKFVSFGHAAHLGGALLGLAYTGLNGRDNVWRPSVEFWKRRLQNKA